jgi:response regulator RpfG family c-di-GMP phosphodiesterase
MRTKRQPLALLLILTQIVCLTVGVVWAAQWLKGGLERGVLDRATAHSLSLATDVARQIDFLPTGGIDPGAPSWDDLQEFCRNAKPLFDGFVVVIRRDNGALVCHTNLDRDPSLLRTFPGRELMLCGDRVSTLLEAAKVAEARNESVFSGEEEQGGQLYQATFQILPKTNALVGVYQSQRGIDKAVAELVNPIVQVGFILVAAVALATAAGTAYFTNRFRAGMNEVHSSLEREVQLRTQSLINTRNAVVYGLAKLAESRDTDTGAHLDRVRSYVTLLAGELAKTNPKIDSHFVGTLGVASTLHDIGKVGVPDNVLLKEGKLTPSERRAMEMHATLGGECLAAIQRQLGADAFLHIAEEVATSHHERWDGGGYPHGARGRDIPLSARIVALADVYDALTTDRPYRAAMSHAEAREYIVSQYGAHFDPEVVEAFVARERDFARLSAANNANPPEPAASAAAGVHALAASPRPALA